MADNVQAGTSSRRSERLAKLLHAFLTGLRPVHTTRDAHQLLESICDLEDHAKCVEKIGCSKSGLEVLHKALRFDISIDFIKGAFAKFLIYLSVPEVKRLANGEFLKRVLSEVVSPPTLWDAMCQAQQNAQLPPTAERSFAWLLLELLTWGGDCPVHVYTITTSITEKGTFLSSDDRELRRIGHRIQHILQVKASGRDSQPSGPGGRHDNDFIDYRQVAIYPTEDELTSTDRPFYRTAQALLETAIEARVGHHLDNQFRLLREDFLAELRDDVDKSSGKKKVTTRRQRTRLQGLCLVGLHCGDEKRRQPLSVMVTVNKGLYHITSAPNPAKFLRDNPNILRNNSFGYFVAEGKIIAFGAIFRVESLLAMNPPIVAIRTPGTGALKKVLLSLATLNTVEFVLIDTAVFAYEPILRCLQEKIELPLWEQLLNTKTADMDLSSRLESQSLCNVVHQLESATGGNLRQLLGLSQTVTLDESQVASLLAGLRQSLSLIQGPPGTGKSFIGALLAKAIHDCTSENILILSYTNHNLDQCLEDLMACGIPSSNMVRLGSKSSPKTQQISLRTQAFARTRSQDNWDTINRLTREVNQHEDALLEIMKTFCGIRATNAQLLEYLEFSDEDYDFFEAFQVPEEEDDFKRVEKDNRRVGKFYLLYRWRMGKDAGVLSSDVSPWHIDIWAMDMAARQKKLKHWELAMLTEAAESITTQATLYDSTQHILHEALAQKDTEVIQTKRIVGCTTTAAAMYTKQLQSASPGVILVEEAGEILESHILTALTPGTKQLILIGDHRQLRPKVNNYNLTVEKGDGYDLNRSLFERLLLSGFPHTRLRLQHRMCPEISDLVRHLTYPDLLDAPATTEREPLRGLQKRVIFIKHEQQELASHVADRRDQGASVSKKNPYEVEIVKKVVKYLAQQGYGTSHQVVLTPYLGQLALLRSELANDNDPILNDLDSSDLVKAGLISQAGASQSKQPLRLSTIDNYQGEESDIVLISLTRSNPNGEIGFMAAQQRLTVLLSRARKALIIIGNPATFIASRKGGELWSSFFGLLAKTDSILDGLPVRCEQHRERQMLLKSPADFEKFCPDGGCSAACGKLLSCNVHECPRKCHRIADHSKIKCAVLVRETCPQGHVLTRKCSDGHPASCHFCDTENAEKRARQERDLRLEQERQRIQASYAQQLAAIQDELDQIRIKTKMEREQKEQAAVLDRRKKELDNAKIREAQRIAADGDVNSKKKISEHSNTQKSTDPPRAFKEESSTVCLDTEEETDSQAQLDWDYQKKYEGAVSPILDELMSMIGLEDVKEQFLEIKSKVDLLVRQQLSIEKERFGAVLQGNPGTGKTTVARLYSKFLCSVGALPGADFVESTGAKLASEGVQGCKKLLDDLLNKGGGAFFIDEAYQLASGSNFGGGAVLDYLLPEVENLTGKVVFILAGYNKQMEKFFQHNPGLPSRFPRKLQFADYEDNELLAIMNYNLKKRYEGRMMLEGGSQGLFARIVARRIGRGRGKEGFGNAREVENIVSCIASRQAKRIRKQRKASKKGDTLPDDMLFTQEDLIGPEPSNALIYNKAWMKLQTLIGLQSVKDSVKALLDSLIYNYQRELAEEPLVEFTLNKVFVGNPGTGKTTVAKLYGQILADLAMLSSGEVVIKKPADFIGNVLGASETNTKAILDAAVGKVLVIDEAYGLYGGGSLADPYRTAVIDTIVAEVQSVPGDDRCVLLLGYKQQMEEMMQEVNPGLARRFPVESGFLFEDFNDDEMAAILDLKIKESGFQVTSRGREVALEVLRRSRNRPHFGNAGEVDILLNDAKFHQQKRLASDPKAPRAIFEAQDFDIEFDRGDRAVTNITMLFKDTVGCEKIITQLQEYQNIVANMRRLDQDPREQIPFAFLFRGPPGTGKTTTAQKMGKVFYDMGFLARAEVVSCSASDLIGEYVGQTGPKTRKLLESALGKVLFIDEAYRLAGGYFAQEAMDELVDCMTKEQFFQKLIIILAGYDADINRLMSVNPGLTSRFPETMVFEPLKPEDCLHLLTETLSKKKDLNITILSAITPEFRSVVLQKFITLACSANFANARDIKTLSKAIFSRIIKNPNATIDGMTVTPAHILDSMDKMITERSTRETDAATTGANKGFTNFDLPIRGQPKSSAHDAKSRTTNTAIQHDFLQEMPEQQAPSVATGPDEEPNDTRCEILAQRDAGVSDLVWNQLQLDRKKAEESEKEFQRMLEEERKLKEWLKACADAKRRKELEELEQKRKELEEKRRQEANAQRMLMRMGRCPVGYTWIKQHGGYRCAGGSHWIDDGQVAHMMSQE